MSEAVHSNASLADIARALAEHDSIAICGHVNPDGDCLGSQLALAHVLEGQGKRVACLLAKDEPVAASLSFLPGSEKLMPAQRYADTPEVFVAVDVPTPERLGEAACAVHARAGLTVTVDHHLAEQFMSDLSYTDAGAASTTLLIWELARLVGGEAVRTAMVATCAYTGLVTDTGRFQYQNVDERCFVAAAQMVAAGADPAYVSEQVFQSRSLASVQLEGLALSRMRVLSGGQVTLSWVTRADMEALGAAKPDAEPLVNALRSIAGVRVACMLREQDGEVRGSLRAKDDTDVAAVAREFGGGGHKAAAGLSLHCSIDEAVSVLSKRLERIDFAGADA